MLQIVKKCDYCQHNDISRDYVGCNQKGNQIMEKYLNVFQWNEITIHLRYHKNIVSLSWLCRILQNDSYII